MRKGHIFLALLLLLLCSCATLSPVFEQPQVSLSSIRMLPSDGVLPQFEIGLHVINPNRVPLKLFGLSYEVELEGHRVLTGVASELPLIGAYGEGDVLLRATPDLFSTIGLFTELLNQPREQFNYNFSARLDVGKLLPKISVEKSGLISFPVKNR
ncbi:LEA14-like dessication related protein [Malonomonas rubra DSM 5091]|uniref:LEA14-like dessication related protein n=1 Tax=Malonomonas rubra DSM 5091 TaxID=1122189 RepID=A0A1M6JZ74_MALRU|nr:LEA type 2 family protein [Malonomonas rubra]SHJ51948.1 LEA14-like dessication related protein [Malonomonas rubra DSM 5091]